MPAAALDERHDTGAWGNAKLEIASELAMASVPACQRASMTACQSTMSREPRGQPCGPDSGVPERVRAGADALMACRAWIAAIGGACNFLPELPVPSFTMTSPKPNVPLHPRPPSFLHCIQLNTAQT
jgi:hypothetical protein